MLVSILSGLFTAWVLGSNGVIRIIYGAIGQKMLHLPQIMIIGSIAIVFGAVVQGYGSTATLSSLGQAGTLAGSFTVMLCAGMTVFLMGRKTIASSTSQAVVGAIIGQILFLGERPNMVVLTKIMAGWVSAPILAVGLAAMFYLLLRHFLKRARIHLIILDAYLRLGLAMAVIFSAYSLGANNIANVAAVFTHHIPQFELDFGLFRANGSQLLFAILALAIAVGSFTRRRSELGTAGYNLHQLTTEAAIVVVFTQALVLFIFSSHKLSFLFQKVGVAFIPVPVSGFQAMLGAMAGVGLVRGNLRLSRKTLQQAATGWIATPILAGLLTFTALFFVQNVFNLPIIFHQGMGESTIALSARPVADSLKLDMVIPSILTISGITFTLMLFLILRQQKLRLKAENELLSQQNQLFQAQRALAGLEIKAIQSKNESLSQHLEKRRKEFIEMAFNLTEQRLFLEELTERLDELAEGETHTITQNRIKSLIAMIRQKMSFAREKENFYGEVEQVHKDFKLKLETAFPGLTEQEKKLATLIRLNLSNKEIATLMSISTKSAEVARHRLKRKLGLDRETNLLYFINHL